jgi:outer membrane protein assembly factor BamE (lipoprotein component of BamABCDE complex)
MSERRTDQPRRPVEPVTATVRSAWIAVAAAVVSAQLLAGCAPIVTKHGHQFQEQDLQQISNGMSQEQVRSTLGTPATTTALSQGTAYYYISSTTSQTAFLEAKEVDRQVVAVYFTPSGSVERVANYGLKDGKVFDFISRSTPSANTREDGILRQLFRNLGQRQIFGE